MLEARENRKSPVRIATVLSQRAFADAAPRRTRRLVHDVVVVERRQVGQLADDRGRDDLRSRRRRRSARPAVATSGPEPLAAGVDQVAGGAGDELVVRAHRRAAARLDGPQPGADGLLKRGIVEFDPDGGPAHGTDGTRPQPISEPAALVARSIIGCGNTPSSTVTTTPKVSAIEVVPAGDRDGRRRSPAGRRRTSSRRCAGRRTRPPPRTISAITTSGPAVW